ncbi:MAG: adenylate kinase [Microcoleaceae cyanobacterium MO_207.B10]|nr:adenylate kinase [Microcoleaceae cyanobacterium MO_207.B10]
MKKVAVFGNSGGGKSILSKKLATITNLPLYVLDKIKYLPGGKEVPYSNYQQIHDEILATDEWVIDGFGSMETLWSRLNEADTLIYIDLPLPVHFLLVTKHFLTGFFVPPDGWPEGSPLLKSSMNSYRTLWLCHKYLTPKYRDYVKQAENSKSVYHLKSTQEIAEFLNLIETQTNIDNK